MSIIKALRVSALLSLAAFPLPACEDHDHDDHGDDASMATVDMIHIPLCIPGEDHVHGADPAADAGVEEGDHSHATCGLQENCDGVLTLAEGLTVAGHDGNYSVMVKTHTSLGAMGNHWMADIMDADGNKVTDVTVVLSTWSVDCMHEGPTAPDVVKADENGMYMLMPVTAHGGPWEVRLMITDGEVDEDGVAVAPTDHDHGH